MGVVVKEIEKSGAIDRRKAAKERLFGRKGQGGTRESEVQDDSVMISEEAKKRSGGRHRKNILEYLAEVDD